MPKLFSIRAGVARKVVRYRRLEKIYAQGDPTTGVKCIQEGGVKLSVVNEVGEEAVVAILGPGDFFGEGCMAGQQFCMGTATAITPTAILSFAVCRIDQPARTAPASLARDLASHNGAASLSCRIRHKYGSGACARERTGPVAEWCVWFNRDFKLVANAPCSNYLLSCVYLTCDNLRVSNYGPERQTFGAPSQLVSRRNHARNYNSCLKN
jgi:hypothetical protein